MTAAKATAIEWFLGRDGTQYGPLSDVEMRKLFELGHLRADDLIWRQGFPSWLPAPEVFKAPPTPAAAPPPPPPSAPPTEPAPVTAEPPPAAGYGTGAAPAAAGSEQPSPTVRAQDARPQDETDLAAAFEAVQQASPDRPADRDEATAPEGPAAAAARSADAAVADAAAAARAPSPDQPRVESGPTPAPARAQRSYDQPAPEPARPQAYAPMFEPVGPTQHEMAAGSAHRPEPASWAGPAPGYGPAGPTLRPERGRVPAYAGEGPGGSDVRGLPASPDDLVVPPVQADAPRRRQKPAKGARTSQKSARRIVATLVVTALLIAAGVGGWLYRDALADVAGRASQQVAALMGRSQEPGEKRPAAAPSTSREPSGLWQAVKAEFPEWYAERTREAAKIRVETKDERAAVRYLTESLVALRRSHADAALAASPESIRKIASTFVANLDELKRASVDHCYTYISLGEANPKILELADVKSATATIEAQIGAVFAAIAEGRRQPQVHLPPRKADYDMLADELVRRGWSDSDLQVFSDPRQLARAAPIRVCGMVRDWFAAHLAIQDPNVQLRLLIESLKPVVAG